MTLHLNGQLPGEVAAHKVGQVPGEDEEEEAKGHGFLHSSVPVGLQHLPARQGREMTRAVRQTTPDTWQHLACVVLTGRWRAGSSTWRPDPGSRCSTPRGCRHTPPAGGGSTASRSHTAAGRAPGSSSWPRTHRPPLGRAAAGRPWREAGSVRRLQGLTGSRCCRRCCCCSEWSLWIQNMTDRQIPTSRSLEEKTQKRGAFFLFCFLISYFF